MAHADAFVPLDQQAVVKVAWAMPPTGGVVVHEPVDLPVGTALSWFDPRFCWFLVDADGGPVITQEAEVPMSEAVLAKIKASIEVKKLWDMGQAE